MKYKEFKLLLNKSLLLPFNEDEKVFDLFLGFKFFYEILDNLELSFYEFLNDVFVNWELEKEGNELIINNMEIWQ